MSTAPHSPQASGSAAASPPLDAQHYRRQLETVANNATLALFILDERQQCTYMNPAAEQLTGFSLAEVQGRALHDIIHHTRPDGSPFPIEECPIDRAFPQNMQEQGEEVFIHKDGSFYPVAFTASPIREGARTVGTIIEVRDIRQEKELEQQRAELEQAKATFFSNVSHEFRTPLTLMLGPLEDHLAAPPEALDGVHREQLDMVHRNGLRLLKMVNTLLDFSRIEAGRIQASYEAVDLAACTRDLASLFRSAIERAGLVFDVDIAPLGVPVYVDRDMWEKIVLNLLSNALKFTMEGRIAIALEQRGEQVALVVSDTGTGIPEDQLSNIFERFHRVRGAYSRTHEGTGIGLALVRELVTLHKGQITVESTQGEGTTFTVSLPTGADHLGADRIAPSQPVEGATRGATLFLEEALRWLPGDGVRDALAPPVAIPPVAVEGPAVEAPEAKSFSGSPTAGRVLLADDNTDMREYVSRLLRQRYDVTAVSNGARALEVARREQPDLVLSDVMMPVLDGFGLLRALREDPDTCEIPVILLSARAGEESRVEGMESGADDYLVKPFSARELMARVGAHLEMARLRKQSREEAERRAQTQRFLAEASASFTASLDYEETLRAIARQAVPLLADFCFFDVLEEDGTIRRVAAAHMDPALQQRFNNIERFTPALDNPSHPVAHALRTGEPVLNPQVTEQDIHALATSPEHLELAQRLAPQSLLTVPISAHGHQFGALTFAYAAGTPRRHGMAEQELAEELARRAAAAIENTRLYAAARAEVAERQRAEQALQRLNETLEQRVAERTSELESTNVHLRDEIHDRIRAEEALERTNAALRQSNRELQEFAYVASHDLQEPLRKISSFVDLLRLDCEPAVSQDGRFYLDRIQDAAVRMSGLIRDVLAFSRLAKQGDTFEDCSLNDIVREVLSDLEVRIAEAGGRVEVGTLPSIEADPTQMRQLFQNLIGNALKFHREGVPPVVVVRSEVERLTGARGKGGREVCRIIVEDNGIGFDEKYLDRIFSPFQRLHGKDSRYEGTGMGLSICRHIAERHAGTISAIARPGEGAAFIVTIPCRQSSAATPQEAA